MSLASLNNDNQYPLLKLWKGLSSTQQLSNFSMLEPKFECHASVLSCFSRASLFATLWTVAHQPSLSTGFSRQEFWSVLPCPPRGDLPNPGIELRSPALAGGFFTTSAT